MCMYTSDTSEISAIGEGTWCIKITETVVGPDGLKHVLTPYVFKRIPEECLTAERKPFEADPYRADDEEERFTELFDSPLSHPTCMVDKGYIHTYAECPPEFMAMTLYGLTSSIACLDTYVGHEKGAEIGCGPDPEVAAVTVWLCRIPAGTKYIRGYSDIGVGGTCGSYAAERVEFVEALYEFTEDDFRDCETDTGKDPWSASLRYDSILVEACEEIERKFKERKSLK